MPMSIISSRPLPLMTGVLFLVAAILSGCASKNPLMSEPAAKPTVATPAATDAPAKAAPAAPVAQEAKPVAGASAAALNTPAPSRTQRWLGIFTPYKQDIQQGNFISHEMAAQIKEGLSKEQVRFLLGVPLLTDMFHEGRWDYLFRLQKANGQITTNRLTIFFKDNRVVRFESTQLPGEVEYISHISGTPPAPPKEAPKTAPEAKPETKQ